MLAASDYLDSIYPYTQPILMTFLQEIVTLVLLELIRQLTGLAKVCHGVEDHGGSKMQEIPNTETEM